VLFSDICILGQTYRIICYLSYEPVYKVVYFMGKFQARHTHTSLVYIDARSYHIRVSRPLWEQQTERLGEWNKINMLGQRQWNIITYKKRQRGPSAPISNLVKDFFIWALQNFCIVWNIRENWPFDTLRGEKNRPEFRGVSGHHGHCWNLLIICALSLHGRALW
jgi:hypothetical protein